MCDDYISEYPMSSSNIMSTRYDLLRRAYKAKPKCSIHYYCRPGLDRGTLLFLIYSPAFCYIYLYTSILFFCCSWS